MRHLPSVSALAFLSIVLGCGSDATKVITPPPPPPPQPYLMTIVSGDAQVGEFGHALPAPLVVSVTTSAGVPVSGVKVNWGIAAGGGQLSSVSSTTDANGKASISWTLGPVPSVHQQVGAWTDVDGSQSALFNATAEETLVLHYDGTTWSRSFMTPNYLNTMKTGWAASPSVSFAAGSSCPPFALRFNNGAWTGDDNCLGYPLTITSMAGVSATDVWAVGTGSGARRGDPPVTQVFHFTGSAPAISYSEDDPLHTHSLLAVAARPGNDVFAVGLGGRVIHFNGAQWVAQTSGTTNDLFAAWADPNSTKVFAAGAGGTIIEYDGTAWQTLPSGTSLPLTSMWGSSANDVFAVGGTGTILHFDGAAWSAQSSGTTANLRGVWGSSPTSVFAVGDGGTLLRYDGSRWTPVSTGFQTNFTGVWGTSASNVFVSMD